jgi:hypothetical protein
MANGYHTANVSCFGRERTIGPGFAKDLQQMSALVRVQLQQPVRIAMGEFFKIGGR